MTYDVKGVYENVHAHVNTTLSQQCRCTLIVIANSYEVTEV